MNGACYLRGPARAWHRRPGPEGCFGPAEPCDQRVLVGLGLRVHRHRVADRVQRCAHPRHLPGMGRVLGEVHGFERIGLEVEKLGRVAHVLVVFPARIGDHETARGRIDRVVFREHDPRRILGQLRQVDQRTPDPARFGSKAEGPDDRRGKIDQRHRRGHLPPPRNAWPGQDHRHLRRLAIQHRLAPAAAHPQRLAVVRTVDHQRFAGLPRPVQRVQHLADLVIDEFAKRVICGDRLAPAGIGGQLRIGVLDLHHPRHPGVQVIALPPRPHLGQRHGPGRIAVKVLLRHDQRKMRRDETYESCPGRRAPLVLQQPGSGFLCHLHVIEVVPRQSCPDLAQHAAAARLPRKRIADRAPDLPDTVGDMHGPDLPVEAGRIGSIAVVQLADAGGADTFSLQNMAPAGQPPLIGHRVVPVPGPVRVEPRRHGRARGDTDRTGRIGVAEQRSLAGQAVQVRCPSNRVIQAGQSRGLVFVGHQEKHVLRAVHDATPDIKFELLHHLSF